MTQLRRVLRVAKEELGFDARRVVAGLVSRAFPQNAFSRVRTALVRLLGVRIGEGSLLGGPLHLTGNGSVRDLLRIGARCWLTGPVHIDLSAPVTIGSGVYMGYHVELLTVDHRTGGAAQRCGPRNYKPLEIGDGVWIGSRAVVLPGVRVGHGSIVAAGAVVTRDVPANVLVGGVPAKVVRHLDGEDRSCAPIRNITGARRAARWRA